MNVNPWGQPVDWIKSLPNGGARIASREELGLVADDEGQPIEPVPQMSLGNVPVDQEEQDQRDSRDRRDRGQRRTAWTAAELMATDFPEPKWAVPGLVAEGLNLFAGPPKVGKSWLAFGLGVSVSSGGKALGAIEVDEGPCLYLALEDTPRRLKSRLAKILGDDPAPAGLTIATECPPLPTGGADRIAGWLDHNPDARLVVIDVFARVRGPVLRDVSAYDADYTAVATAKALADNYGVAVVLVHHTRKAADDDWLATISGTHGLAGASDAIGVLRRMRGKADGVLSLTGRDIDEAEYALRFAADLGAWQLTDTPVSELRRTDTENAVVAWLTDHEGHSPKQVADGAGLEYEAIKKAMARMVKKGSLDTDGQGHYWTPVPAVPPVPFPGQSTDSPVPRLSPPVPVSWIEPGKTPRHKGTSHRIEYLAEGWEESGQPKTCGVQLELARAGLPPCREPTVWRHVHHVPGRYGGRYTAHYCDEHLPDECREHLTEGNRATEVTPLPLEEP